MERAQLSSLVAAFVTVLFWSSAFPAVKFCLQFYSPESVMLLRFLVASATLGIYCAVKKTPLPRRCDWPLLFAAGFVGIFLYMWTFNTGTNYVMSGVSSFVIASAPVFTLLFSRLFLGEVPGRFAVAGIIISFAGLVLIAVSQVEGVRLNTGVWLLLLAAVCTSIYNILQRKILTICTPIVATTCAFISATLCMLVFLPKLVRELPAAPPEANAVVVFLGVVPAALAYFLWSFALSKTTKTIYVTSFLYLTPFLATLMGFFWLGEVLGPLTLAGGVVIIAGMVVTGLRPKGSG